MSDHEYFNCSEEHEFNYVVSRYKEAQRAEVRKFLNEKCDDKTIHYSTHDEVYALIKRVLGYDNQ